MREREGESAHAVEEQTLSFAFLTKCFARFVLFHFLLRSFVDFDQRRHLPPVFLLLFFLSLAFLSACFSKSRWRGPCLCLPPEGREKGTETAVKTESAVFFLFFSGGKRARLLDHVRLPQPARPSPSPAEGPVPRSAPVPGERQARAGVFSRRAQTSPRRLAGELFDP